MAKFHSKVVSEPADVELTINPEELSTELMEQPLYMRKYTKIKADLSANVKAVEAKLKRTKARVFLGSSGSIKDKEAAVELDDDVQKFQNELIEAETLYDEYEGIVRAFMQRHDVLKDLAANRRREVMD